MKKYLIVEVVRNLEKEDKVDSQQLGTRWYYILAARVDGTITISPVIIPMLFRPENDGTIT